MLKKPEWLKGIIPAIVTPFTEDNRINEEIYRELIRYLLPNVDGIVTCGTTGEFVYLSNEEKINLLRITVDEVKGKVPVIFGAACPSTKETLELTCKAKELGATAALVAAPYFIKPSFNELYDHFETLNEVNLPLILYNIPQCTGVHFKWWTAEGIAKLKNVAGIKDTSGDIPFMEALFEKVRDEVAILVGHDEVVVAALAAGADGAILASANVIPDIWQEIYHAVKNRDLDRARNLQAKIQKMIRIIARNGATQAVKEALHVMGFNVGNSRLPIMRGGVFRREDYEEVRSQLEELGKIPRKDVIFDLGNEKTIVARYPAVYETPEVIKDFRLKTGEAFSGPPLSEVAHTDLIMGLRGGPVDEAIEKALKRPDSKSKPRIISNRPKIMLVPTVTIRTSKQESQVFKYAAEGIIAAVNDSIKMGVLPEQILDDIVIVVNVFVHPGASIKQRVKLNNYKAMRAAIRKTIESRPTIDEIIREKEAYRHPFRYAP